MGKKNKKMPQASEHTDPENNYGDQPMQALD